MVYISKFIDEFGERIMDGGQIDRYEALKLINIEQSAEVYHLLSWANRIRESFHGNKIKLCSIINAKAGSCPEDCKFCAQSAFYNTESPKYGLVEKEEVFKAMEEANRNGVNALAIVAAGKGLNEGKMLDLVCETIREMKNSRLVRPDASLGIIKSQSVADRLREAGVECYNHNLESSRRYFPELCSTHSFDDRLQTIKHLKNAGIKICSGGIIGMGETREDRCDLALALREVKADVVPINILNPIKFCLFCIFISIPQLISCFFSKLNSGFGIFSSLFSIYFINFNLNCIISYSIFQSNNCKLFVTFL